MLTSKNYRKLYKTLYQHFSIPVYWRTPHGNHGNHGNHVTLPWAYTPVPYAKIYGRGTGVLYNIKH